MADWFLVLFSSVSAALYSIICNCYFLVTIRKSITLEWFCVGSE